MNRHNVIGSILLILLFIVAGRAVILHLSSESVSPNFPNVMKQYVKTITIPSMRGDILDRNGETLALSTPMVIVGVRNREFTKSIEKRRELAKLLDRSDEWLSKKVDNRPHLRYVKLKDQVSPDIKKRIVALNIEGIEFRRGVRRYYPDGDIISNLLGFTNSKDRGQEGVEKSYNYQLNGYPEKVQVIKDREGKAIETVGLVKRGKKGGDFKLSIDRRVQFIAYQALRKALQEYKAVSGTVVVLDSDRGEVLAMVNLPSYNPNDSSQRRGEALRNRAVTDVLEPGSTMKPLTIASALEYGVIDKDDKIDTSPGRLRFKGASIGEYAGHNYGVVSIEELLWVSSNVGSAKVALKLTPEQLWSTLDKVGVGRVTGVGFPGEVKGKLRSHKNWVKVDHATISYGHGIDMTPLQIAQAYLALAEDGVITPITLLHNDSSLNRDEGRRVFSAEVAKTVRMMLEGVTSNPKGTAKKARVAGYRVGGKTGTAEKLVNGRYKDSEGKSFGHTAIFAGMAPIEDPKIVAVVVVVDPQGKKYTGGWVAAPVFSEVVGGALRIMGVAPQPNNGGEVSG